MRQVTNRHFSFVKLHKNTGKNDRTLSRFYGFKLSLFEFIGVFFTVDPGVILFPSKTPFSDWSCHDV
jgi:hypothetical protein